MKQAMSELTLEERAKRVNLKNCPFCGSKVEVKFLSQGFEGDSCYTKYFEIDCPNAACCAHEMMRLCGKINPTYGYIKELENAIEKWNTRAGLTAEDGDQSNDAGTVILKMAERPKTTICL